MIIVDNINQLSDEWFQLRLGNPGASNFSKIVTTKGEPSKQAEDYMYQLAGELVAKQSEISFVTPWMERGTQMEGEARDLYSFVNNCEVREVGMLYYDDRKDRHASPDFIRGDIGGEIKCPMAKTHVRYLLSGKLPTDYYQQVHGGLYIASKPPFTLNKWHFCSYYPGLPLFQIEVERDEKFCTKLDAALDEFCGKLAEVVKRIKEMQ